MLDWIALALLSVSWLPGLGYYHGAEGIAWIVIVPAGTFLLGAGRACARLPAWQTLAAALAMIVPAVWLMPWPYRAAPGLMAIGLVFGLAAAVRIPMRRWLGVAARTCLLSGCLLLAQSLAMIGYAVATSRSHLLPSPLPQIVAAAVKALGIDSSVCGTTVAVFSMRKNHLFTATWELLLDPPTWCFLIGAAVLLWWKAEKGTVPICAKHPPGRSGKWGLSPFSLMVAAASEIVSVRRTVAAVPRRAADRDLSRQRLADRLRLAVRFHEAVLECVGPAGDAHRAGSAGLAVCENNYKTEFPVGRGRAWTD